jgi:hypothetical protein
MGWGSAIGAGLGLLGANQQSEGAEANANAMLDGIDFSKQVYGDAQGNFAPYLGLGQGGVNGLQALLGGDYSGFYNSPDYQAAREAMTYGVDHSAAARGSLYSGGHLADLSKAQGDLATGYLGNYRGFLGGLAQMGQQSAGTLGSIGTQTAGNVMQGYGAYGNARQSAYDARAGGLYGLGSMFGNWGSGGWGNGG